LKRILFVDDESKILDGIRRMLHSDRQRWEMQFAVGGEAALQACEVVSFDVVVSDMRMPGMDGATLLGHIRERFPGSARVILSGYSEITLATRAVPVAHRYLAKPCGAAELRSTIEQVCALQEVMRTPEIQQIVGTIGELPSLSSSYTALAEVIQTPEVSIEQVARIIEQDIAMSAKVLQLANSAFFGLARTVTDARSAVGYLGMATVKNLALASEAFRVFVPAPRIPREFCESMQSHAQRTAAIAALLPMDKKMKDVTIVAALLHDVGRLVLASRMPDKYCSALSLARERKCEPFEAEEEILGTSHAEIGAYLLGLWGIPTLAVEAIAHHHHPTRVPHLGFDSSVAVYVADLLAHMELPGSELRESDRTCLETLGVWPQFSEFSELALQGRN
jgi:HD-like signal output (HDOD) protein